VALHTVTPNTLENDKQPPVPPVSAAVRAGIPRNATFH
jgi:hypothetical protein